MLANQVIKAKYGKMETLLDSGPVDLSKLGRVSVSRASEILFDEPTQKYYIHFLQPELGMLNTLFRGVYFPTYKSAVQEEIKVINHARKTGII